MPTKDARKFWIALCVSAGKLVLYINLTYIYKHGEDHFFICRILLRSHLRISLLIYTDKRHIGLKVVSKWSHETMVSASGLTKLGGSHRISTGWARNRFCANMRHFYVILLIISDIFLCFFLLSVSIFSIAYKSNSWTHQFQTTTF